MIPGLTSDKSSRIFVDDVDDEVGNFGLELCCFMYGEDPMGIMGAEDPGEGLGKFGGEPGLCGGGVASKDAVGLGTKDPWFLDKFAGGVDDEDNLRFLESGLKSIDWRIKSSSLTSSAPPSPEPKSTRPHTFSASAALKIDANSDSSTWISHKFGIYN